jgi:DNA-binding transcriptional LysR family regulator
MQIDALKIYCDVVRFRSFSRGAEANDVLQATASQTVQRLEEQLGVTLIDRSCRPWELTPEGQLFYDGSREIVERYHEVEAAVRRTRASVDSVIRVAAIYSVNLRDMSGCVQRFHELRPEARVEIEYLHPDRVCERVLNGEVNLGIISFPQHHQGLAVIPWREEPMVLACQPRHPLAKEKAVTYAQLAGEPYVGFDADLVIGRRVERHLKSHGAEIKPVLRFDNIEAIKRAVEAGSGVSVLPLPTLEHELRLGTLAAVPFARHGFARPLGIVYRRGRKLYANTEAFIEVLKSSHASKAAKKG